MSLSETKQPKTAWPSAQEAHRVRRRRVRHHRPRHSERLRLQNDIAVKSIAEDKRKDAGRQDGR